MKKICKISECGRKVIAKDYCNKHWRQAKTAGGPYSKIIVKCKVPFCDQEHVAKGYCQRHYYQIERHGAVHSVRRFDECSAPKCNRAHFGFGYCEKHLDQIQRNGHLLQIDNGEANEVFFDGNTTIINFYKNNKKIAETIIDAEDYEKVKQFRWNINCGYVVATIRQAGKSYTLRLHRLILGLGHGRQPEVDHIDRNPLNNRKRNLRICDRTRNCWNKGLRKDSSSKVNGVFWNRSDELWQASIYVNKKIIRLGKFDNLTEAATIRRNAELKYYGEFAPIEKSNIL